MTGAWVFVCGASGSGKDSVIESARQLLRDRPDIVFSRRMVTRAVQAGSDHDPVTQLAFSELLSSGGLSWHWQAHGFFYGVSRHYAEAVRAGRLVVVNGSRAHVLDLPPASDVRVVQIAADPGKLAARLVQRGRDSPGAVADRLARNSLFADMPAHCMIVNDGALALAGQCLADYLASYALPTEMTYRARSSTLT
jgi:ribose 1,5-bisphosphokinase